MFALPQYALYTFESLIGSAEKARASKVKPLNQQRYVVETITMTTVTERRVVHEETNTTNSIVIAPTAAAAAALSSDTDTEAPTLASDAGADKSHSTTDSGVSSGSNSSLRDTYPNSGASEHSLTKPNSISAQITGILKGGKLWKSEQVNCYLVTRLLSAH